MRKHIVQALLSVTLPLTLVVGCADTRQQNAAVDRPAAGAAQTPTYIAAGSAVNADDATPEGIIGRTPPPPGSSAGDWALGERLRGVLTEEKSLAPYPSQISIAVEKDSKGLVTLRGYVANDNEKQKLHDRIAQVPGVLQIDDQIVLGLPLRATAGGNQGPTPAVQPTPIGQQ
jgi:hypothetical protein